MADRLERIKPYARPHLTKPKILIFLKLWIYPAFTMYAKAPLLNNCINLLTYYYNCVASTGPPKRVYYEE